LVKTGDAAISPRRKGGKEPYDHPRIREGRSGEIWVLKRGRYTLVFLLNKKVEQPDEPVRREGPFLEGGEKERRMVTMPIKAETWVWVGTLEIHLTGKEREK